MQGIWSHDGCNPAQGAIIRQRASARAASDVMAGTVALSCCCRMPSLITTWHREHASPVTAPPIRIPDTSGQRVRGEEDWLHVAPRAKAGRGQLSY